LFIDSSDELLPVEDQEHFHRQMTNSLVAIEERMVAYQREPQGRGLCRQTRIQVFPSKRHLRLSDCGFEPTEIPQSFEPTRLLEHEAMKLQ
jgi:hypothetical protein